MTRRATLRGLVLALTTGACVRWGVPDDDEFGDESTSTSDSTDSTDTSEADSTDTGPEPWPEQQPFSSESRLVTWGKSGIPTTNLALHANAYAYLAGIMPGEAQLAILWIADCDPRTDPLGCLAGNVQPYFDMVTGIGTVEFQPLDSVDPSAYDVVVADFCGPLDGDAIASLLASGVGVLALGDNFCMIEGSSSAERANATLAEFGVRFVDHELYNHAFTVPAEAQNELLAGVTSLDAWGVALQETIDPVVVLVETIDGAVLTKRSEP
jgi:hypothetical protein